MWRRKRCCQKLPISPRNLCEQFEAQIINMKKLVLILTGVALLGIASSQAEEKKEGKKRGPAPTAEQKAARKELLEKYDANKDGKLDKEEKSKISAEDKEKMEKAGGEHHKKKKE